MSIKTEKMKKVPLMIIVMTAVVWMSCQTGDSNKKPQNNQEVNLPSQHSETGTGVAKQPQEVLADLKQGNAHFVERLSKSEAGDDLSINYPEQMQHTATQQHPVACILTCMDSRVSPEIIFHQGIGSLFVIRVAGNVEDPDVLGSMEYAVAEKGVGLIVVMGHRNCGAIGAAFGKLDPGNKDLNSLVSHVKSDIVPNDKPPYDASAKHNVKKTIDGILTDSKTLHDKVKEGKLVVVGALYDVSNGTIDWNTTNW
jgi:carbonic anhydrase